MKTWSNQGRGSEACRLATIAALRGFWCDLWPAFAVMFCWLALGLIFQ